MKKFTIILFSVLLYNLELQAQDDLTIYYGLLHAHTWYSDGSGTPEEAYAMARQNGLDFFAVTPHNHIDAEGNGLKSYPDRKDGVLIAKQKELYNGTGAVSFTREWKNGRTESFSNEKSVITAAGQSTNGSFLAIYGQEFSTGSSGNHVNVFGIEEVIEVGNGEYDDLIDLIDSEVSSGANIVVQLNHPDVVSDLKSSSYTKGQNDYGFDDYGKDFRTMVVNMDEFVHLIEVFSGPALDPKVYDDTYKYGDYRYTFSDYYFYLQQGFHLSPSVGQDNHFKTWGKATPARTAVLAKSLSQEDIFDALRNHRTYATEDKNMELGFYINDNIIGSKIDLNTDDPLMIKVTFEDPDNNDGTRSVELFHGIVDPQNISNWSTVGYYDKRVARTSDISGGEVTFSGFNVSGDPEFYFIKLTQNDGQRVVSAPIWINYGENYFSSSSSDFYWTANTSSKVYHEAGCKTIKLIKPSNLRNGDSAPAGRNLHACVFDDLEEEH